MAEDLDRAIKQIAQMFGVSSNSSNQASNNEESPTTPSQSAPAPQPFNMNNMSDSLGILSKARDMIDSFNNVSDSRIGLLNSIHPFLGPKRQQGCASCVQLLKIIAVISSIAPKNQSTNTRE